MKGESSCIKDELPNGSSGFNQLLNLEHVKYSD